MAENSYFARSMTIISVCIFFCMLLTMNSVSCTSATTDQNDPDVNTTQANQSTHVTTTLSPHSNNTNSTKPSSTGLYGELLKNKEMLLRTVYVICGLSAIVILYFVVKTIRKKRRGKARKYGLIASGHDNMEMAPLDVGDDDDDYTLYEMNGKRS